MGTWEREEGGEPSGGGEGEQGKGGERLTDIIDIGLVLAKNDGGWCRLLKALEEVDYPRLLLHILHLLDHVEVGSAGQNSQTSAPFREKFSSVSSFRQQNSQTSAPYYNYYIGLLIEWRLRERKSNPARPTFTRTGLTRADLAKFIICWGMVAEKSTV